MKILNSYTPIDDFEKRVTPSFVRKVQVGFFFSLSTYTSIQKFGVQFFMSLLLIKAAFMIKNIVKTVLL